MEVKMAEPKINITEEYAERMVNDVLDSVRKTNPTKGTLPTFGYENLTLGAKICSTPAIDRQFKTIDFLALFDINSLKKSEMTFFRLIS